MPITTTSPLRKTGKRVCFKKIKFSQNLQNFYSVPSKRIAPTRAFRHIWQNLRVLPMERLYSLVNIHSALIYEHEFVGISVSVSSIRLAWLVLPAYLFAYKFFLRVKPSLWRMKIDGTLHFRCNLSIISCKVISGSSSFSYFLQIIFGNFWFSATFGSLKFFRYQYSVQLTAVLSEILYASANSFFHTPQSFNNSISFWSEFFLLIFHLHLFSNYYSIFYVTV